jgi:uncharacterized protein (DUF2164 family)
VAREEQEARRSLRIRLADERRAALVAALREHFRRELDEELSEFRAVGILDFFLKRLGPTVYNQAIQDARAFVQEKLDDLDAEFYEREEEG